MRVLSNMCTDMRPPVLSLTQAQQSTPRLSHLKIWDTYFIGIATVRSTVRSCEAISEVRLMRTLPPVKTCRMTICWDKIHWWRRKCFQSTIVCSLLYYFHIINIVYWSRKRLITEFIKHYIPACDWLIECFNIWYFPKNIWGFKFLLSNYGAERLRWMTDLR